LGRRGRLGGVEQNSLFPVLAAEQAPQFKARINSRTPKWLRRTRADSRKDEGCDQPRLMVAGPTPEGSKKRSPAVALATPG